MTPRHALRILFRVAALGLVLAALAESAAAQTQRPATPRGSAPARAADSVVNPLQGFSTNRNLPIHIEAATLEVRDKEQIATFSGKVHVVQGDTDLRCDTLIVYYESQPQRPQTAGSRSGQPPGEGQQIRRLEVKGNVIVTQKDQTATGDSGFFDMRTQIITLVGNVVVNQGKNVLRGDRLVVDMNTGISRMESNSGRVQGLFVPTQQDGAPRSPGAGLMRTN